MTDSNHFIPDSIAQVACAEYKRHDPNYSGIALMRTLEAVRPLFQRQILIAAKKIAFDVSEGGQYMGNGDCSGDSIYQQGAFEVYEALDDLEIPLDVPHTESRYAQGFEDAITQVLNVMNRNDKPSFNETMHGILELKHDVALMNEEDKTDDIEPAKMIKFRSITIGSESGESYLVVPEHETAESVLKAIVSGGEYDFVCECGTQEGANNIAILMNNQSSLYAVIDVRAVRKALIPFHEVASLDIGNDEADSDFFTVMKEHNKAKRLTVGDFRNASRVFSALSAEPVQGNALPQDVINLIIAARDVVYGGHIDVAGVVFDVLDQALEAFAELLPWENEPEAGA